VGNNPKIMFGAPLGAALVIYLFTSSMFYTVAVAVLGLVGAIMLIKRSADAEAPPTKPTKPGAKRKGRKVNDFSAERATPPRAPSSGGLPTWGGEGLETWQPRSLDPTADTDKGAVDRVARDDEEESGEPALEDTWGKWENDWSSDEAGAEVETVDEWSTKDSWLSESSETATTDETSPLSAPSDLDAEFEEHFGAGDEVSDTLEAVDPDTLEAVNPDTLESVNPDTLESVNHDTLDLDELDDFEADFVKDFGPDFGPDLEMDFEVDFDEPAVEMKPAAKVAFSFSSAPPMVNEDVSSADDIIAASHATELIVPAEPIIGPGGDSELARLLAKVQARLSAYE
jgi:hypothetical protein